MNFVIVTPAKNEEKYIERTILSVIKQSILPDEWIIVDDGSSDSTYEICSVYASKHNWIKPIQKPNVNGERGYGQKILDVFYFGYSKITVNQYDFFTLLDADIQLPSNYFEEVIKCLSRYPEIGLCGGKLFNLIEGDLYYEPTHPEHIRGAFKTYRRKCFEDIGGFKNVWNWDGLDDMEVMYHGWKIKTLDVEIIHLKPTGSNYNLKIDRYNTGYEMYLTRYGLDWILMKFVQYIPKSPFFVGSLYFIKGYLVGFLSKRAKVVDSKLGKFIRKTKRRQLFTKKLH
jgi:poly-beta-1,6-N-acetyl-D-glucosamine synthase